MTISLPLLQDCTIHLRAGPVSTLLFHSVAKAAAIKQKSLKSIQFNLQAEQLLPVHIQSHTGFLRLVTSLQVKAAAIVGNIQQHY